MLWPTLRDTENETANTTVKQTAKILQFPASSRKAVAHSNIVSGTEWKSAQKLAA